MSTQQGTDTLVATDETLSIVVNRSTNPRELHELCSLDASGKCKLPSGVQKVLIEVGTNDEPEMTALASDDPNALLIAFEPQPPVFKAMLSKFPKDARSRLIPVPAAVSPTADFIKLHVSEHRGCTSLLPQNKAAESFARHHKNKAPKKGVKIQLRTVEFCAKLSHTIEVPVFPLGQLFSYLPPQLPIEILMTDAQGFDTTVLMTMPRADGDRVGVIVTECQDLEPGHTLFLVTGAPNCAQQRACIESQFPHRLDFCWDNAPKVRELNCIYRHPKHYPPSRKLPPKLKVVGVAKNITYVEAANKYRCPI